MPGRVQTTQPLLSVFLPQPARFPETRIFDSNRELEVTLYKLDAGLLLTSQPRLLSYGEYYRTRMNSDIDCRYES